MTRSVIDLREAPPLGLGRFVPLAGFFSPLIAVSHDGTVMVYVGVSEGETQLFKRRLDTLEVHPIAGTRGAHYAFFSPDDRWIGFLTTDKVMKIPINGGTPVTLANARSPVRAKWTSTGVIMVGDQEGSQIFQVPERGGSVQYIQLKRPLLKFSDILPQGNGVLVSDFGPGSGDYTGVYLYDLTSHTATPLLSGGYDARYLTPGFLVFARGGDLHVVRFDEKRRKVIGESSILQPGVAMDSFFRQAQYALSDRGILAYVAGSDRSVGRICWVDRANNSEFLRMPNGLYGVFDLSPDGRKIAVEVSDVTRYIWVFDLQRSEGRRVPAPESRGSPLWNADGRKVIFASTAEAGPHIRIVEMEPNGQGSRVLYSREDTHAFPLALSSDGRTMVFLRHREGAPFETLVMDTGDHSSIRQFPRTTLMADISPDGKWIAYISDRTGRTEVWVSPLSNLEQASQLSAGGGHEPVWCRTCPELFYRNGARWYSVPISTVGELKWESPRLVWETDFIDTPGRSYDVSADGKRLLVSKRVTPDVTDRIHLVQNWRGLLPLGDQ